MQRSPHIPPRSVRPLHTWDFLQPMSYGPNIYYLTLYFIALISSIQSSDPVMQAVAVNLLLQIFLIAFQYIIDLCELFPMRSMFILKLLIVFVAQTASFIVAYFFGYEYMFTTALFTTILLATIAGSSYF